MLHFDNIAQVLCSDFNGLKTRQPFQIKLLEIQENIERNGNPLQYSCLENSTDRGACRVHGVEKSQTQLSDALSLSHTHTHTTYY